MHLLLCLFGVIIALLVTSAYFNGSSSPEEHFECNYAYKAQPTPRGCFRYTAKANDTCTGIQNMFKTTANNVVSKATGDYCVDSTASSASSPSSHHTPALQAGQTFRICPPPQCIYKKLSYDTTCGHLAMKYNTKTNNIHFRERSSNAPMQPCVDANQSIPTNARIQLCQNDDQDTAQLLDTYDSKTYEECKALCHNYGGGSRDDSGGSGSGVSSGGSDSGGGSSGSGSDNPKCTHMLYGNGTCRLFKKATPLMNIVSSNRDSNAFRCSTLPTLQYAGALPKEVGNYTCDGNNTCAWLGGQGCEQECEQGCSDSTSCIPPYKKPFPSPSSHCAWQSIAQQHPEMMRAQKEFVNGDGEGDVGRFLSGVCGG